jgi:5-formyltetrahydrofolate cyclo-ligase
MIGLQKLRQQIYRKRCELSQNFRNQASQKVTNIIINTDIFKNSKHIALYMPVRGEMDPTPIIKENKIYYLPILKNAHLIFGKYKSGDALVNNQYGIPEPTTNIIIQPKDLDIVITPLVAFDKHHNRLGTGKGYYDRTFAFKKQHPGRKPYLIGIAYNFQKTQKLSPQPWDIPLNAIVTEQSNKGSAV